MLKVKINSLLDYIQPTKYIVSSEEYSNEFNTPVLTAGDTFLLGYTNDKDGIYNASKHNPIILFDDFTTAIKWVDFPFKVKSSACKIIVSKTKTNLRYCYYAMKAMNFDHLQHKRYWISEYSEQLINDYEDENSKIVAELDNITDTISKKEQVILNLDELIKSRFIEMFGDPDANPFDWEIVTINDVCSSIVRGPFGSALKKEFFVPKSETTIKVYEQQHAIKKNDKLGTYYVTKEKYQSLKRFTCHEGDILMSCSGTMGELYQLPIGCEKGIINQALCKFTLNQKMLPIVFLESMKHVVDQIDKKGSGIQNIAAVSYVKSMKMCLPPIQIQKKFVTFYEQVDKSKFIVQKEIKDLQELLDKKMDEYFGQ